MLPAASSTHVSPHGSHSQPKRMEGEQIRWILKLIYMRRCCFTCVDLFVLGEKFRLLNLLLMQSERDKLLQFVSQRIDHSHNPQSFRYQLEAQINNHLKLEEQMLKHQRIRARNQQILQQELERREELHSRLQQKGKRSSQNKEKKLEERVKSMAELRRRKQEYTASKLKESRKEELKRSLEKIKQIQKEREDLLANKLTKTEKGLLLSRSLSFSRIDRRNHDIDAKHDAMVLKLTSKGIFSDTARSRLSKINAQRGKIIYQESRDFSEDSNNKIGAKLEKIEGARERKEAILREKAQKIKQEQAYQQKMKRGKLAEIESIKRAKHKKMQSQEALRVIRLQSLKEQMRNGFADPRSAVLGTARAMDIPKKKGSSFRKEIRQQIEQYKFSS